ncbi:hypothetical protein FWK35_00028805 [Aphis craccivora]|uniref:Uncharacterized protein n=1 Tax=Aphis craccivora TaxID=307492 RepID=A0A6G0YKC7_APHCR|nr:hypothetical protein FWK35_00028805 [Aphis craccivora]
MVVTQKLMTVNT